MGSAASLWEKQWKYKAPPEGRPSDRQAEGGQGRCVIATSDFDPESIRWPKEWGAALPLKKSIAIQIISDDGSDRAYGHYVGQPQKCGYFLKHLTEVYEPSGKALGCTSTSHAKEATLPAKPPWKIAPKDVQLIKKPQKEAPSEASTGMPCSPSSTFSSPASAIKGHWRNQERFPESQMARQVLETSDMERCSPSSRPLFPSDSMGILNPLHPASTFRSSRSTARSDLPGPDALTAWRSAQRVPGGLPDATKSPADEKGQAENVTSENGENGFPTDENLAWLVEAAASAELPEGWITFADDDGKPVYYHEKRRQVTRKHPMMEKFKAYARRLQKFYQFLSTKEALKNGTKIRAHLGVVLNEVLNRCHRELPPMTPEMLERFFVVLFLS